jgi:hypothetical protein
MYRVIITNDGIETTIHWQGFGSPKVQSGTIQQGINVADTFNFTVIPNNVGYSSIYPLTTLIKVINTKTNTIEFDGRVLSPTSDMDTSGMFHKSFVCESELGYLNDSNQRFGTYTDASVSAFLQAIITNHNNDVIGDEIDKRFTLGIVEITPAVDLNTYYLEYENTMDVLFDKLINVYGGELRVRKENNIRYLDYLIEVGEVKETEIRLAKNLTSLKQDIDPMQIITRLVPLGATIESEEETDAPQPRVTVESVNGGKDYILDAEALTTFGSVTKSETWDDVTDPAILLQLGEDFLSNNNKVKMQYSLTALDLSLLDIDASEFNNGNYHRVVNEVMKIDESLRIVERTVDIINAQTKSLTIGDVFKTTSQYNVEIKRANRNVVVLQNTVSNQGSAISALSNSTNTALQTINLAIDDLTARVEALEGGA